MKAYSIRNGEIFEPEVKEERTNKHRKENEQECNCNRPYEIELTEQEWLQTATTEQLAEWIAHQTMIALLENQNNHSLRMTYPAYWVEWLKQPHTNDKE